MALVAVTALAASALTATAIRLFDDQPDQLVVATTTADGSTASSPTGTLDVASLVARTTPGVVSIRVTTKGTDVLQRPVTAEGAGTGFVATADGVIYTNAHVVAGAAP